MSGERRRRVPRRIREQRIIDVAVQVFARRGYHPASVDEIAARILASRAAVPAVPVLSVPPVPPRW